MSTTETTEVQGTISPKDFAELVGSDPKTVRRFLRANTTERANKGGRWEISTDDVEALTTRWNERAKGTQFSMKAKDLTVEGEELTDDEVDELTDELEEDLDDIDEL